MSDETKFPIDPRNDTPGTGTYKQSEIKSTRIEVITTANDKINVTEPSTPSHPEYGYHKADVSLSGHIKEVDDTPGAERLAEMHKSGTFWEIHPDGSKVLRIYGKDFYLCLDDHTLFVGGNLNITVQGDANLLIAGDMKTTVKGNYDLTVHGDMKTRVRGKTLHYSKGDMDIQTRSSLRIRSELLTEFQAKASLNIQTEGTYTQRSDGIARIFSKSRMYIDGTRLDLNLPGGAPQKLNIKDIDPTGGLSVEDSTIEPSVSTMMIIKAGNNALTGIDDTTGTYPKDRKPID